MANNIENLLNREELRRLEKAAKDKNKAKLADWASQYSEAISKNMFDYYEKAYVNQLGQGIDTLILSLIYTLHNNKNVNINPCDMEHVLDDLIRNIDAFKVGSYKPQDYEDILNKSGITIKDMNYKGRITKLISIIYDEKYHNEAQEYIKFLEDNDILYQILRTTNINESKIKLNVEMINMCDALYVFGDNEYIEKCIDYANQIGKTIMKAKI